MALNNWTYEQNFDGLSTASISGQDSWVLDQGSCNVVETDSPYQGTKHLKIDTSGVSSYCHRNISGVGSGTMHFAFKYDGGNDVYLYLDNAAVNSIYLRIEDGSGQLEAAQNNGASWPGQFDISADTYYKLSVQFECTTGGYMGLSQYTYRLKLNDGPWTAPIAFNSNASTVSRIQFLVGNGATAYFDDIAIETPDYIISTPGITLSSNDINYAGIILPAPSVAMSAGVYSRIMKGLTYDIGLDPVFDADYQQEFTHNATISLIDETIAKINKALDGTVTVTSDGSRFVEKTTNASLSISGSESEAGEYELGSSVDMSLTASLESKENYNKIFSSSLQPLIAVDSVTPKNFPTGPTSFSHTCSGDDRLLVVLWSGNNGGFYTPTYNGVPLTRAVRNDAGAIDVEIWYLVNPPAGSHTVTVDIRNYGTAIGGAISFSGVDQSTPIGATKNNTGTSSSQQITPNHDHGIIIDGCSALSGAVDPVVPGAGQTLINSGVAGATSAQSYEPHSGDPVTMSWNFNFYSWAAAEIVSKIGEVPIGVTALADPEKFTKKVLFINGVDMVPSFSWAQHQGLTGAIATLGASKSIFVKKAITGEMFVSGVGAHADVYDFTPEFSLNSLQYKRTGKVLVNGGLSDNALDQSSESSTSPYIILSNNNRVAQTFVPTVSVINTVYLYLGRYDATVQSLQNWEIYEADPVTDEPVGTALWSSSGWSSLGNYRSVTYRGRNVGGLSVTPGKKYVLIFYSSGGSRAMVGYKTNNNYPLGHMEYEESGIGGGWTDKESEGWDAAFEVWGSRDKGIVLAPSSDKRINIAFNVNLSITSTFKSAKQYTGRADINATVQDAPVRAVTKDLVGSEFFMNNISRVVGIDMDSSLSVDAGKPTKLINDTLSATVQLQEVYALTPAEIKASQLLDGSSDWTLYGWSFSLQIVVPDFDRITRVRTKAYSFNNGIIMKLFELDENDLPYPDMSSPLASAGLSVPQSYGWTGWGNLNVNVVKGKRYGLTFQNTAAGNILYTRPVGPTYPPVLDGWKYHTGGWYPAGTWTTYAYTQPIEIEGQTNEWMLNPDIEAIKYIKDNIDADITLSAWMRISKIYRGNVSISLGASRTIFVKKANGTTVTMSSTGNKSVAGEASVSVGVSADQSGLFVKTADGSITITSDTSKFVEKTLEADINLSGSETEAGEYSMETDMSVSSATNIRIEKTFNASISLAGSEGKQVNGVADVTINLSGAEKERTEIVFEETEKAEIVIGDVQGGGDGADSYPNVQAVVPITVSEPNSILIASLTGRQAPGTCQFNGVNMTLIGAAGKARLYYMSNPPVGTYNLQSYPAVSTSYNIGLGGIVLTGVNLSDPFGNSDGDDQTSNTCTANITPESANSLIVDSHHNEARGYFSVQGAGQTLIYKYTAYHSGGGNGGDTNAASYKYSDGSQTTMSWSRPDGTGDMDVYAAEILPEVTIVPIGVTLGASKSIFVKKADRNVTISLNTTGQEIGLFANVELTLGARFCEEVDTPVLWLRAWHLIRRHFGGNASVTLVPDATVFVKKFLTNATFTVGGSEGTKWHGLAETSFTLTTEKPVRFTKKPAQAALTLTGSIFKKIGYNLAASFSVLAQKVLKFVNKLRNVNIVLDGNDTKRIFGYATVYLLTSSDIIKRIFSTGYNAVMTLTSSITKKIKYNLAVTMILTALAYKLIRMYASALFSVLGDVLKRAQIVKVAQEYYCHKHPFGLPAAGSPQATTWWILHFFKHGPHGGAVEHCHTDYGLTLWALNPKIKTYKTKISDESEDHNADYDDANDYGDDAGSGSIERA